MADNILRLRVQSDEYDAKLKKAAEGIRHLAEVAHKGGGELTGLEKAELDYVKALGSMETKSRTAAGSVRELESTFKELTVVYNHLNDVEKQDEGGKALRASLDQIKQRAKEARTEIENASKALGDSDNAKGGIFSGLGSKMEGALAVFGGNLMTKAAGAIASIGSEMADMVKQGVEMAKAGEGIRIAFERLGRGDILDGLREATHGTVTDLELMKAAVKFNDFKLPIDELGTMLAFAQQKAKDTGQSVDYMVESITTGLGRKSLMILDNLGLSATEIRERMKETGDMTKAVGSIIRDQMAAAGDYVETAADRAAQANVSLQNKMEELGRKFAPVEEASNQLWTSMKIGILDIIGGPLARLLNGLTEAGRLKNMLNDLNGGGNGKESQTEKALRMLREYSGGGRGTEGKRDLYNRQVASYKGQEENAWREANRLREELKGLRSQQKENGLAGNIQPLINEATRQLEAAENRAKAIQIMRANYQKGAEDIFNPKPAPTTPVVPPTKPTKPTTTAKDLDAEQQVQQKINDLLKEALTADASRQGEIRQQVAELQKQQEKYKDIKNLAQGILPKDKEAVFTIDGQLSEETKKNLREIENVTIDDKTMTVTADTQEAMQKVQELIGQVSTTTLQMKVKAQPVEMATGLSGFNEQTISAWTAMMKSDLQKADLGSALYSSLTHNMEDMSRLTQTVQSAIKLGLEVPQDTVQQIFERIFDGENMPADMYDSMIQKFIDDFKESKGKDLVVGENGELSEGTPQHPKDERDGNRFLKKNDEGKYEAKMTDIMSGMAGGIQNVVTGLNTLGVEIPAGLQSVLGGMQAVSSILSGIAVTVMAIEAIAGADAIIPFARGGIVPAFAQGGVIPKFADGGLIGRAALGMTIPGNSMSGDNLRLPVDGGRGMIGVNSGEVILNRAQQGNLASQLEGGAAVAENTQPFINGEMIYLGLQAYLRRSGLGEIVTSER